MTKIPSFVLTNSKWQLPEVCQFRHLELTQIELCQTVTLLIGIRLGLPQTVCL